MEALVFLSRSILRTVTKTCALAGAIVTLGPCLASGATVTDTNFNVSGSGASDYVYAVKVRSDGKIVIGGYFGSVNGVSRPKLAILNTNGTLDTNFSWSINGDVRAIAVQWDDSILIGGDFTTINSDSHPYFAHILADGTVDSYTVPDINGSVRAIEIDEVGYTIVGGTFTSPKGGLLRLDSDGYVDSYPENSYQSVYAIAINRDQNSSDYRATFVGGSFSGKLAKLDGDYLSPLSWTGTLSSGVVNAIALQRLNGVDRVFIGGTFSNNGNVTTSRFAALTGSSANPISGFGSANAEVKSILVHPDSRIFVGGLMTDASRGISCYLSSGTLDPNGQAGYGASWGISDGQIWCMALQGTNIVVGGYFLSFYPSTHDNYERLIP
jgi:Domain of unknown function (DUF5122) beta-propeller